MVHLQEGLQVVVKLGERLMLANLIGPLGGNRLHIVVLLALSVCRELRGGRCLMLEVGLKVLHGLREGHAELGA